MNTADLSKMPTQTTGSDRLLTALLSHDIRSALSGLLSAAQLLEETSLGEDSRANVDRIKLAAIYIDGLLGQALNEPQANPATTLGIAIDQLSAIWSPEAEKKGLKFSVIKAGVLPRELRFSNLHFMRVFNNIIGNALKFSKQGRITLSLRMHEDGALEITVLDDGPGFSDDARAKLFLVHGRPEVNDAAGSGLGLYIAHTLVIQSGAKIIADNQEGGGAKISVIFPEALLLAVSEPDDMPVRPQTGLPDLSHLRILLAEDNPTNQLVASQMLKKMNAVVETASDGVEALERFEVNNYNLGLIDIEMPRKSGLEVMREMRARDDGKANTTILALTAYVLPEHKERILAAGADGIIAKPLTDIAAFGSAILAHTGGGEDATASPTELDSDTIIQMDIYNGLKEIIGKESMNELLDKVNTDLCSVRDGIRLGDEAGDVGPIRANTHILISVAGAIGAVNLQHIAEQLNTTAKSEDWAQVKPQVKRCEKAIDGVLKFVVSELSS